MVCYSALFHLLGEAPNRITLVLNNLIDFMTKNSSLNAASEEIVVGNYIRAPENNNKKE